MELAQIVMAVSNDFKCFNTRHVTVTVVSDLDWVVGGNPHIIEIRTGRATFPTRYEQLQRAREVGDCCCCESFLHNISMNHDEYIYIHMNIT